MADPVIDVSTLVPPAPLPEDVQARVTMVDIPASDDLPGFTAVFVEAHEAAEVDARTARLMDSAGVAHAMFHRPAQTTRGTWAAHGYLHF